MLGGLLGGPAPAHAQEGDAARDMRAVIAGSVFDSITMRPLAGAVVQLARVAPRGSVDLVRSAVSDSMGAYRFGDVMSGTYLLGFQHVAIDSLGLRAQVQRVDVRTAAAVRAPLAIPSLATIVATVCGRASPTDSLAVLVGNVRDARTDEPLPGSFVSLRWGEILLARGGMRRQTPIVDVYANGEGWYSACVPGSTPVLTRASHANDVSGDVELEVPAHAVWRRDLYVGHADALVTGNDSARRTGAPGEGERVVTRGTGTVRGVVRALDGRPIGGVRVAVLSGATEARSDSGGQFTLRGVPQGTHTLEARSLGYLPSQAVVDIVQFRESAAEIVLVSLESFLLDTVRVAAARQLDAAARAGFERRRRGGVGYFLDEAKIDSMRAFSFKDILRAVPGVRFVRGTRIDEQFEEYVELTFGRSTPCLPAIYLDGMLLVSGKTDLDVILTPAVVRRVEVYHRGTALPAEFASSQHCGVIAVWTAAPPRRRPG